MTDFTEPPEPKPEPPTPPRSLRARFERFAARALVAVVVVALSIFGTSRQVSRVGLRHLNSTVAQLDAEEDGWRMDDIQAERRKRMPHPDHNGALVVLKVAEKIPADWERTWRDDADWLYHLPEPPLPLPEHVEKLKAAAGPSAEARTIAIRLRDLPTGHYPVEFPADRYSLRNRHLGHAMNVCNLLEYDAALAILVERDPNRAIRAAHAALNAARSIGDEPTMAAQQIRMIYSGLATRTAMQTLAWSEPADGLAELQRALLEEANEPLYLNAMRGHRADMHRLFSGLEAGHFTYADIYSEFEGYRPQPLARPEVFRAYRPFLPGDHAEALKRLTRSVAIAKRPSHEWHAATLAARTDESDDFRYQLTRQFVSHIDYVAVTAVSWRAALNTAAVGIAAERFRRANGRWPNDLAELVPAFLTAVPVSPFDTQPLRYRATGDRITVSCRTEHTSMHQAPRPEFDDPDTPGMTVGVQLWLPRSRALPPKPKPKDPEPEKP